MNDQKPNEAAGQEVTFEQYRVWKRNSLVLYDLCLSYVLEFPALSLDFQHTGRVNKASNQALVGFALGTNTPAQPQRETNFFYVKQLVLPSIFTPQPADSVQKQLVGGYGMVGQQEKFGSLVDLYAVSTQLEPNCVCFCPVDPDVLLVLNDDDLQLYDLQTVMQKQVQDQKPNFCFSDPDGGFSLAVSGVFAAHGGNSAVSFYDLKQKTKVFSIFIGSVINQVAFSPFYSELAAVVTDDGELILIDFVGQQIVKRVLLGNLVEGFIGTALAFSPFHERVLAIASEEGGVALLDLVSCAVLLHQPAVHAKAIYQIRFSPFHDGLLLTGSEDAKCTLLQVKYAERELKTLFVHCGHTMAITDAKFHPLIPNLIGSTAEDNSLQFWWPAEGAFK